MVQRPVPFEKLYRIGDVMRYSGLSRQTVHNYTVLGLITEQERTAGGHRLYPEDVFDYLEKIKELRKTRTLSEIRTLLEAADDEPAESVAVDQDDEENGPVVPPLGA